MLLVATGRVPNGDTLGLDAAGVAWTTTATSSSTPTSGPRAAASCALGDVSSPDQLKHVANHEARVVQHNLLHPDALWRATTASSRTPSSPTPQVASVGLTEEQARDQRARLSSAVQQYGDVAYGWAMEDSGHFVKLLATARRACWSGAHLIGPEASSLIQPLIQAMSFGQRPHDVARGQYWIHPAMAEVVENALLELPA